MDYALESSTVCITISVFNFVVLITAVFLFLGDNNVKRHDISN